MDRLAEWVRRVWYLLNRRRLEAALREEMEAHRAEMARPTRFGNLLRLREEARDVWGWNWLDDLGRDLTLGLRALRRSPAFALTSVLILSVGIGLNLAFFQLVNVTLLQPLGVKDPHTLVFFHRRSPGSVLTNVPYPMAIFVEANSGALSAVLVSQQATVAWDDERVTGLFVSANWFDELGASAAVGRVLHEPVDGAASAAPVVVLSHGWWQRRLGGRADAVGSTIRINRRPALVAGVADPRFPGLRSENPQLWLPIEQIDYFQPGSRLKTDWSSNSVSMYGRLSDGMSPATAKASLQATLRILSRVQPDDVAADEWLEPLSGSVRFMSPHERRQILTIATAITALATLVLLIACLNLSNLTLARVGSRVRELSIRAALGAGRWRAMRHVVVEIGLLACAGAAGGLVLGLAAASWLASIIGLPPFLRLAPDVRTILAVAAAALVATLAVGIVPAWRIGRRDLTLAIRDGGERASQGLQAARRRQWLVACQIAGSCVLLVIAGQMARSLQRALATDQGFSVEQVAVLEPSLEAFGVTGSSAAYWDDVRAMIAAHPDTERMTLVAGAPLSGDTTTSQFAVAQHVTFRDARVDPLFFSTLRIPILAGRTFQRGDTADTAVIVSRRGALEMYGTLDVLGKTFPKGDSTTTKIVGIAGDAQLFNIRATGMAELYRPVEPQQANVMLVRAKSDPTRLLAPLRDAARAADGRVAPEVRLMRDDFNRALRAPRLASTAAGLTALLALALTTVGIFGIVSYGAARRTREIGVRLALGASRGSVVRALLQHTVLIALVGIALGLLGGWPIGSTFAGHPFYLQPLDIMAYVFAGLLVLVTGSIAALLPTWRTLRQDPLRALRHE